MNTSLRLIFIFLVSVFVSTQAWGSLSTKVLEYHYDADAHFQNHQYAESKGEKLDYDAWINLLEFLAIDVGKFAIALYSGNPAAIQSAALDVGASLVGVASPVPGIGQAIKGARAGRKAAQALDRIATKGSAGGTRAGKPFTRKGKAEIDQANADKNSGLNVCESCGVKTVPGQRSQRGVTPPGNERQRDHIIPKSKDGDGSPSNGQILCRTCNIDKSDKI